MPTLKGESLHAVPARVLPVIVLSRFAGISLWFAGNAVLGAELPHLLKGLGGRRPAFGPCAPLLAGSRNRPNISPFGNAPWRVPVSERGVGSIHARPARFDSPVEWNGVGLEKQWIAGRSLVLLEAAPVGLAVAGEWGGPYLPQQKVEMMMAMEPDTLKASVQRGSKLFKHSTLGKISAGQSCASCHPKGGAIGGAAEMSWKGIDMKVAIPSLKKAATQFPKPAGPMKAVVDVTGMNNMCIMTFLKGTPLDRNAQESLDLAAYVTSFADGKKVDPGGAKNVPNPVPGAM